MSQYESKSSTHDIFIIGAGLPRTGTTSLKTALEILGFGPVYHMSECFKYPEHSISFRQGLEGAKIDWRKLLNSYRSTLDIPTCSFYEQLMEVWPEAKIILTVRDSDEVWFKSLMDTLGERWNKLYYLCIYPLRLHRFGWKLSCAQQNQWRQLYDSISPSMHSSHNERVKKTVPADRLLVFNVKEGWEPLCSFLAVPVPSMPFPNVHDTKAFKQMTKRARMKGILYWITSIGIVTGCTFLVVKYIR